MKAFQWISMSSFLIASVAWSLTGCNPAELQSEINSLTNSSSSSNSSGNSTGSTSSTSSGSECYYTAQLTYDLGPGIDVTESFSVYGGPKGVPVIQKILASSAQHCPQGIMIPAAGDSQQLWVYAVSSAHGRLNLYPSRHSQPTVMDETTPNQSLMDATTITLSMDTAQISNGQETQQFESGSLQSASANDDAQMVVTVTYYYEN